MICKNPGPPRAGLPSQKVTGPSFCGQAPIITTFVPKPAFFVLEVNLISFSS